MLQMTALLTQARKPGGEVTNAQLPNYTTADLEVLLT